MSRLSDPCWMGQHDRCKSPFCRCDCGCQERNESLSTAGVSSFAGGATSPRMGATEKTAPGGALTPESQGLADWIGVD